MAESKIIDKIILDAEAKAKAIVEQAEEKAQNIIDGAKAEAESFIEASKAGLEREKDSIISRRETVAMLEGRKIELGAKQALVDEVFRRALDKLLQISEKDYQDMIVGMLEYAEDGDIVTVNKSCKSMLPKVFFTSYAKLKGIKLGYNTSGGTFSGGMILSNGKVDKNFTFEAELDELKDTLLPEIVAKLF